MRLPGRKAGPPAAAGPSSGAGPDDAPRTGERANRAGPDAPDPALIAERERLTERFTVMQTELGGLFYEMAIREHVRLDVLMPKAAALQKVDAEISQVEHMLAGGEPEVGGRCPRCGTVHARGAVFCSQCAQSLAA